MVYMVGGTCIEGRRSSALLAPVIVLLLVLTSILTLWLYDIQDDRKHSITVNAITPVFVGTAGVSRCEGTQLTTLQPGKKLAVRRIRYLKDCAAIDVALPDGREGHIVLGVGDVSVNPPLPTI